MVVKQLMFIFVLCWTAVLSYPMCGHFIMKQNWNYRGNDLEPPTVQIAYRDCCAQCSKNERCKAFTWRRDSYKCYLKSSVDSGGQSDTNADVGRRLERVNMSNEYQLENTGKYADDSIRHMRSHEDTATSFSAQDYQEDWIDDNGNMTDLDEYADGNNHTVSSWNDDIGSGPIAPAYRFEENYEGIFDISNDGPYQLVHAVSGKVLEIYNQDTHDGANVQIWSNRGGQNQLWIIYRNENDTLKLINPRSSKALDVGGDHTSDGSNVQIYTDTRSNTQRWHLKQVGDDVYKLIHLSSGKALDVKGDTLIDGTNVQIRSENDEIAQRWRLIRYQHKALSFNQPKLSPCAVWKPDAINFANGSFSHGLFVNEKNSIYVADKASNRITVWLEENNTVARTISGGVNNPNSVFVSIDDDIYVDNSRVDQWTSNSTNSAIVMNISGHCEGLFLDTDSTLYCTMPTKQQVVKRWLYSNTTTTIVAAGIGFPGSASNMLHYPRGIFVDFNFDLYVADSFNHRIQRFHHDESNAATVVGNGAPNTIILSYPSGVVLDADGFLFIVDQGNNRVIRSGPFGFRCIAGCSSTSGSEPNQLNSPWTMNFDSYGNMFVADSRNYRVQKFILARNSCAIDGRSISLFYGMNPIEEKIFMLINNHRKQHGLPSLQPSVNLAYVAHTHAVDFIENSLNVNGSYLHSWSDKGKWKPVTYTPDHKYAHLMWSKPSEISNYTSEGFEIAYAFDFNVRKIMRIIPNDVVNRWKTNPEHNNVIIQQGGWIPMKAMGVGVYKGYACVWFGQQLDTSPAPGETEKEKSDPKNCNGTRCGCRNQYCWAYSNGNHTTKDDWWCYTQQAGIKNQQNMWQTCMQDSNCYWGRTCGNCTKYKGNGGSQKIACDTEEVDLREGDMRFPPPPPPSPVKGRGVLRRGETVTWSNGIVPYEIAPGYDSTQRSTIIATMRKMEDVVSMTSDTKCIQFREKNAIDKYFITIKNEFGCSSIVGQDTYVGRERTVTLLAPGCLSEGIIMHEFLHTLGFYHEQSRPDRDNYVTVNYKNIPEDLQYNFKKYNSSYVDVLNTPYDYDSVMHYGKYDFSLNHLPTIEPRQDDVIIGQREYLSTIDVEEVRMIYNCSSTGKGIATISTTTNKLPGPATTTNSTIPTSTPSNIDIVSNETYQLVHAVSDKVLDVYKERRHDGANVQIWRNHRGENQLWIIYRNENDTLKLINTRSGKALDVGGDHISDGSNVQIHKDTGSHTQIWHLKKAGDGVYKLIHWSSGKALDVKGGAIADGTNVQIWPENDGIAQRWRLIRYQPKEPWVLVATNHVAYKCPYIRNGDSSTITTCQASCDATELCTAINYQPGVECVLIQCSNYPPITARTDNYVVWARRAAPKWHHVMSDGYLDSTDCPPIGTALASPLNQCQALCEAASACNALNYRQSDQGCWLVQCSTNSPRTFSSVDGEGWIIDTRRATSQV